MEDKSVTIMRICKWSGQCDFKDYFIVLVVSIDRTLHSCLCSAIESGPFYFRHKLCNLCAKLWNVLPQICAEALEVTLVGLGYLHPSLGKLCFL